MTPEEASGWVTRENTNLQLRLSELDETKKLSAGQRYDSQMHAMEHTEEGMLAALRQTGGVDDVLAALPNEFRVGKKREKMLERLKKIATQPSEARARQGVRALMKSTKMVPDQNRAILKAMGIPVTGKTASQMRTEVRDLMERMTGDREFMARSISGEAKPLMGHDLNEIIINFEGNMSSARQSLQQADVVRLGGEGLEVAYKGFARKTHEMGKALRKNWRKFFKSDVGVEELEGIERALVAARAGFGERAMGTGRELLLTVDEIAKDIGVPTRQVEDALREWLEGSFGTGEMPLWWKHIMSGGEKSEAAVQSMLSFLSRSSVATPTQGKILKAMGVEDAAQLERLFPDDEARRFVHGERPVERALASGDPNVPNWMGKLDPMDPTHRLGPGPNSRRLSGGTHQGEYLGYLADKDLIKIHESLVAQGQRKLDTEEILQRIEDIPGLNRLKNKYDLSTKKLVGIIKQVKAGKPITHRKTGKRFTPEDIADITAFVGKVSREDLALLSGKGKQFDWGTLNAKDPALAQDFDAIDQLLKLRDEGKFTQMEKVPPVPAETTVGPRTFLPGALRDEGGRITSSTQFQRGFYRLTAMTHDLKRYLGEINSAKAVGRKPYINQSFIDEFEGTAQELNNAMESLLREGLGPKGDKLMTAMREIQKESFMQAYKLGMLDQGGSPLGYIGRLMSPSGRAALEKLELVSKDTDMAAKLAPSLPDSMKRKWDEHTIEELNVMYREGLEKEHPELAAKMKGLLEDEGLLLEKFESSPIDLLVNKLGTMGKRSSVSDFFDDIIADGADMQVMGGRIVGVVDDQGKKTILFGGRKITAEFEGTGAEIIAKNRELIRGATGVVLEQADGTQRFIRTAQLGQGMSLTGYGTIGHSVGDAFAVSMHGGKGVGARVGSTGPVSELNPEQLENLMGQWATYGTDSVIEGARNAVSAQFDNGSSFLRGFDSLNYVLRKFQTVFRPAFHVSNLSSGYFQTLNLGVSHTSAMAGHMDAFRVLFGADKEWVRHYDRYSALIGDARIVGGVSSAPEVAALGRRIGPKGLPSTEIAEDLIVDLGAGRSIPMAEVLDGAARNGLFGTLLARGFEGGATTPRALSSLRKQIQRGDTTLGKLGEKIGPQLETGEIAGRLGAVFAQLREGVPLEEAILAAKKAMVDYGDLTKFERTVMKRTALYYTFARKFIPHAWKQFGQDPRGIAAMSKVINDAGLVTTVNGQVELKVGDYRTSLQRAAAPLDALMVMPALAERLAFVGHGPEDLTPQHPPGFLATGGVANIIGFKDLFHMDPRPSKGWFDEFMYSTFATKWVMQGFTGEGEGPLAEMAKFLIPHRKVDPGHEQRILSNNYARLLGDIKRRMVETESPGRRKILYEEAKELQNGLKELLEREKKWPENISEIRRAIEAIVSEEF